MSLEFSDRSDELYYWPDLLENSRKLHFIGQCPITQIYVHMFPVPSAYNS